MLTFARIFFAIIVAAGLSALSGPNAAADSHEVCVYDPETQTLDCEDRDDDGGDGDDGGGGGGDGTPACFYDGEQIPCSTSAGYWSASYECYIRRASPQPEPDHDVWDGRTDGAVYVCTPPDGAGCDPSDPTCSDNLLIWAPEPPSATPPINPEDLAREAIASMQLQAMEINMAPPTLSENSGSMVPVGLPVWMWTDDTPRTWGPISASASDRGLTVGVTANVARATWGMGDGDTVTCREPGTPYQTSYGVGRESPDCGHRYDRVSRSQPGDSYEITASSHWTAHWSGGGQTGELAFRIDNSDALRVGEIQAVRVE